MLYDTLSGPNPAAGVFFILVCAAIIVSAEREKDDSLFALKVAGAITSFLYGGFLLGG